MHRGRGGGGRGSQGGRSSSRQARASRGTRAGAPRGVLETIVLSTFGRREPPAEARGSGSSRPHLVDLCAEWLALVQVVRSAGTIPDAAGLRARALELKSKLEREASAAGLGAVDVEAAVYALVAFLDEIVLNSAGAAREVWVSRPLQLELFGQNVAGEEFFDRLERMRREREPRIEALEVYFTCLALGFGGKFKGSGPERLQALVAEVARDVAAVRGARKAQLAPHAMAGDELTKAVAQGVPLWLSLAVFVPAMLLTYLAVHLWGRFQAHRAADTIHGLLGR